MTTAFVIETSRITAGIVTGERRGFRFYTAHPSMTSLEGTLHRSLVAAQRAAERLAQPKEKRRKHKGTR